MYLRICISEHIWSIRVPPSQRSWMLQGQRISAFDEVALEFWPTARLLSCDRLPCNCNCVHLIIGSMWERARELYARSSRGHETPPPVSSSSMSWMLCVQGDPTLLRYGKHAMYVCTYVFMSSQAECVTQTYSVWEFLQYVIIGEAASPTLIMIYIVHASRFLHYVTHLCA